MALIDISGTGAQRKLHSDGRDSSYVAVIAYELEFSDRQRRSWIQLMRPDFKSSTKIHLKKPHKQIRKCRIGDIGHIRSLVSRITSRQFT